MNRSIYILISGFFFFAGVSYAVTLQLSDFTGQTIVGNENGVPTSDLTWGVIVDRDGDGFGGYSLSAGTEIKDGLFGGTDDYLFLSHLPSLTLPFGEGVLTQIVFAYDNLDLVNGGETYAIIWFTDTKREEVDGVTTVTLNGGSLFGLDQDPALILPESSGDTADISALRGDPVPSANMEFGDSPPVGGATPEITSIEFLSTDKLEIKVESLTADKSYQLVRGTTLEEFPDEIGDPFTGGVGNVFEDANPLTGPDARAFYRVIEVATN